MPKYRKTPTPRPDVDTPEQDAKRLLRAREAASQMWCTPETSHLQMQPELAEVVAKRLADQYKLADILKETANRQAEIIRALYPKIHRLSAAMRSIARQATQVSDDPQALLHEVSVAARRHLTKAKDPVQSVARKGKK